jgi:hypothetical protein
MNALYIFKKGKKKNSLNFRGGAAVNCLAAVLCVILKLIALILVFLSLSLSLCLFLFC